MTWSEWKIFAARLREVQERIARIHALAEAAAIEAAEAEERTPVR